MLCYLMAPNAVLFYPQEHLWNILLEFIDMTDILKTGSYIKYSFPMFQHEILWMLYIHIDDL